MTLGGHYTKYYLLMLGSIFFDIGMECSSVAQSKQKLPINLVLLKLLCKHFDSLIYFFKKN
jgi:hypothetical protein